MGGDRGGLRRLDRVARRGPTLVRAPALDRLDHPRYPHLASTDLLIEHHRAVAAGGTAMTTVSYVSVSEAGRAYGHEMWMRKEILPDLRRLTDAVHKEGGAASVQLGHCGYFASKADTGFQPVGASRKFNLFRISFPQPMTEADINQVIQQFASAALLAREAGFDAVEIHSGHGYLLSQFLSPCTNKRTDNYGGSLENRMRLPAGVVRAVRQAMGPDFPVMVKMNLTDGIKGGIEIEDGMAIAKRFERKLPAEHQHLHGVEAGRGTRGLRLRENGGITAGIGAHSIAMLPGLVTASCQRELCTIGRERGPLKSAGSHNTSNCLSCLCFSAILRRGDTSS